MLTSRETIRHPIKTKTNVGLEQREEVHLMCLTCLLLMIHYTTKAAVKQPVTQIKTVPT